MEQCAGKHVFCPMVLTAMAKSKAGRGHKVSQWFGSWKVLYSIGCFKKFLLIRATSSLWNSVQASHVDMEGKSIHRKENSKHKDSEHM